ncbi:hypothetical protein JCM10449v2_001608 [Rhodotorula kratochvilovae]
MRNEDLVDAVLNIHMLVRQFTTRYMFMGTALVVLHIEELRRKLKEANLAACPAAEAYMTSETNRVALNFNVYVAAADLTPAFLEGVEAEGYRFFKQVDGRHVYTFHSGGDRHFYVEFTANPEWDSQIPTTHVPIHFGGSVREVPTYTLADSVEALARSMVASYLTDYKMPPGTLSDLRWLVLAQVHVEEHLHRPMMFGLNARDWAATIPRLCSAAEYHQVQDGLIGALDCAKGAEPSAESVQKLVQWLARAENGVTGPASPRHLEREFRDVLRLLYKRFQEPYDEHAPRPSVYAVRNRRSFPNLPLR